MGQNIHSSVGCMKEHHSHRDSLVARSLPVRRSSVARNLAGSKIVALRSLLAGVRSSVARSLPGRAEQQHILQVLADRS